MQSDENQNNKEQNTSSCNLNNPKKCSCGCKGGKFIKIILLIALVLLIIWAFCDKSSCNATEAKQTTSNIAKQAQTTAILTEIPTNSLPTMVEMGASWCPPCRAMSPIIEQLANENSSKLNIVYIDVDKNQELARKMSISSIPVQIFLDKNGKEIFRHIGFFPKEDILKKWKDLGYNF